jgi:hypothetical protein
MKDWQILAVLIALACLWLTRCIDHAGNLVLKRIDELEEKLDEIESKQDDLCGPRLYGDDGSVPIEDI